MIVDGSQGTGVSAIWLLANVCYAGMRAQGHPSRWWRVVSFLFGLPGTLLSVARGEGKLQSRVWHQSAASARSMNHLKSE
jgi:hypothetical protein